MQLNLTDSRVENASLLRPLQLVSLATPLLALLQAVLAGQGWFEDHDFFDIHEIVANIFFLVVVLQLGLTYFTRITGSLARRLLMLNALLLVLTVMQIGLGYSGRDGSSQALAWHVPIGTLIVGLAVVIALLTNALRSRS
jgi:hypothetical protein